jgi:glycosyltransferase
MKISIITVVYNNSETIGECIQSVLTQAYRDLEYIIIDGGSKDGTLETIQAFKGQVSKVISEPDGGIYEAMNKGLGLAGGDIVGFLHSDDLYAHPRVIEKVAEGFETSEADCLYGDLLYVDKNGTGRVVRYWKASDFKKGKFRWGWMPPHPTFFVKKAVYERYGFYQPHLRIAADYEMMLRLLEKYQIGTFYLPEVLVKMRWGGVSNRGLRNLWIKSREDLLAWKLNGLSSSIYTIPLKNLSKIPQFFMKKGQDQG